LIVWTRLELTIPLSNMYNASGMVPWKTRRGRQALRLLHSYEGVPPVHATRRKMVVPECMRVVRCDPSNKVSVETKLKWYCFRNKMRGLVIGEVCTQSSFNTRKMDLFTNPVFMDQLF